MRTLQIVARGEPFNLGAVDVVAAGPAGREVARLFYATMDFVDERGLPQPYLAEALPVLNSDSWRVSSDGRMETTYRLRPNLTWHDGTPLVADDFVFAAQVYAGPALGLSGRPPMSFLDEVVAPDQRTIVFRWNGPYTEAGSMAEGFAPLPRHILQTPYSDGDLEAFRNHPYWTHENVGLGPYRLDRWEPGASIEGVAFDGHALGKAKIQRVRVVFMPDSNAALAALLSGEVHAVMDSLIRLPDMSVVEAAGGVIVLSPVSFRITQIQFRPEMGALRPFQDVRVRQAIAHSLDKQGINDALMEGKAVLTDTLVSPLFDYYPEIEGVVTKYRYDTRRAQQLLEEAGLTRGSDGFYASSPTEPFKVEVRTVGGAANEAETNVVVEGFRRMGLDASMYVFPVAQLRDNEAVTTFPALFSTGRRGGEANLSDYTTSMTPGAGNRWFGGNRGGWSNPEYDRLWEAFNTTLDRSERVKQIAGMEKIFSDAVPAVPHFYYPRVLAHVSDLKGPRARVIRDAVELVQIHDWEWER
jgi:peptide/nickel transport system substrate-binding protein